MSNVPSTQPDTIPNHLTLAVVSTVLGLCFSCFAIIPGIVAIIFSSQVNKKLVAGDTEGAKRASWLAKLWSWITIVLAALGLALLIYLQWKLNLYQEAVEAFELGLPDQAN